MNVPEIRELQPNIPAGNVRVNPLGREVAAVLSVSGTELTVTACKARYQNNMTLHKRIIAEIALESLNIDSIKIYQNIIYIYIIIIYIYILFKNDSNMTNASAI